jgi:hypothetical protein
MKSAAETKKATWNHAATCYCCDAPAKGLAWQWVGGKPEGRIACARHAWEKKNWPAER